MATNDDYYRLLGVNKNATETEIKKAYGKLALQHPSGQPFHGSFHPQIPLTTQKSLSAPAGGNARRTQGGRIRSLAGEEAASPSYP